MSQRRGCLAALLGLPARDLLADPRARAIARLPEPPRAVHPTDRPALDRARRAALGCAEAVATAAHLSDQVRDAVVDEVAGLLQHVHALTAELDRARRFLAQQEPARLDRERAELEVRALEADIGPRRELEAAIASLKARGRLAIEARAATETLSARLLSASTALEALRDRAAQAGDPESALAELRAQEREAARALQAWEVTARELA